LTTGPIIVLSFAYAGADRVQHALAAGSRLACTSGTGILPQCAVAAEAWRHIEGQPGTALSSLATAAIRGLVTAQITAILTSSGQQRWCELATTSRGAAETFLQVFPQARFVCAHRACLDVVRVGVQASPWGLQGQVLTPFLLTYPGNNVAALAAYWAACAEQLLAFERSNRQATYRLRYEDVTTQPDQALTAVRAALDLGCATAGDRLPVPPAWLGESGGASAHDAQVPVEMIPEPLRQRVSRLHAELGYPPLEP
jgi:hypothetical protein